MKIIDSYSYIRDFTVDANFLVSAESIGEAPATTENLQIQGPL